MKYFFVSDEIGSAIYFNHPKGQLLCFPIPTAQQVMSEKFNEVFTSIVCGDGESVIVFQKYENIFYTVVSNEGETESFLRKQLRIVHDLLMMVIGQKALQKKGVSFQKQRNFLQKLVDTMTHLSSFHQSFLVEGIEMLEVNDEIRNKCVDSLKRELESLPDAFHGMLFVGSKLICTYSKHNSNSSSSQSIYSNLYAVYGKGSGNNNSSGNIPDLFVSDIFLFISYFMASFHPPEINFVQETEMPVADYSDHSKANPSEELDAINHGGKLEAGVPRNQTVPSTNSSDIAVASSTFTSEYKYDYDYETDKLEDPMTDGVSQLSTKDLDSESFQPSTSENVSIEAVNLSTTSTQIPLGQSRSSSYLHSQPNPEEPLSRSLSSISLTSSFSQDDTTNHHYVEPPPVYTTLHLRTGFAPNQNTSSTHGNGMNMSQLPTYTFTPHSVFFAELDNSVTLVIVNKQPKPSDEEREKLQHVQRSIKKSLRNYLDYFITKDKAHLSILSYLQQLPGLIHFIFVDRVSNRVIAPTIGPLHGQQVGSSSNNFGVASIRVPGKDGSGDVNTPILPEETSEHMTDVLRKKVWQMCYQAQKHLAMGYSSMLVKEQDFQYSYRLWVEDNEGKELSIETSISQATLPTSATFYKDLLKRVPKASKCYELYGLFLSMVPVHVVASYERKLIGIAKGLLLSKVVM